MDATIVLNKEAVDALFPEGSELRVMLAHSAVRALAESTIKPSHVSATAKEMIERAKKEAVVEAVRTLGGTIHSSGTMVSLPQSLKDKFREQAKSAVEAEFAPVLMEVIEEKKKALQYSVEYADAQLHRLVSKIIAEKVSAALVGVIAAATASQDAAKG